ncbi:MAG: hypothetical protein M1380_05360 [Chloroflexi bacterium]|nr:hypothetical protein [Chloroflexota bacterium]
MEMRTKKRACFSFLANVIIVCAVVAFFLYVLQLSFGTVDIGSRVLGSIDPKDLTAADQIAEVQAGMSMVGVATNALYLLVTVAIAVSGVKAYLAAAGSVKGAQESAKLAAASLEEMKRQGESARQSADAQLAEMKKQSESARQAADAQLEEMKAQAAAARDSAWAAQETSRELAAQRAAAVRPYLVFVPAEKKRSQNARRWEFNLKVRNIGFGPAMDVQGTVFHGLPHRILSPYGWAVLGPLASGESKDLPVGFVPEQWTNEPITMPEGIRRVDATARVEYKDVEGRTWRAECPVVIGARTMLADGTVPSDLADTVSIEPGKLVFEEISGLTQL